MIDDRTSGKGIADICRNHLFTTGNGRSLEAFPPTQGTLIQHTKRATYQTGYIWGQSLIPVPEVTGIGNMMLKVVSAKCGLCYQKLIDPGRNY